MGMRKRRHLSAATTAAAILTAAALTAATAASQAAAQQRPPKTAAGQSTGKRIVTSRNGLGGVKDEPNGQRDKSLDPNGEPWTGPSLLEYFDKRHPREIERMASSLKIEIDAGRKRQEIVVSETPQREKLLAKIAKEFEDSQPTRAIAVCIGREEQLKQCRENLEYRAIFSSQPRSMAANVNAQMVYWAAAVEVIDFSGDEEAAAEYDKQFAKLPGVNRLDHFQWYGVVVTGSKTSVDGIRRTMEGLERKEGGRIVEKVAGYEGYPVAAAK